MARQSCSLVPPPGISGTGQACAHSLRVQCALPVSPVPYSPKGWQDWAGRCRAWQAWASSVRPRGRPLWPVLRGCRACVPARGSTARLLPFYARGSTARATGAKGTPSRGPSAGLSVAASGAVTRTLRGPVLRGGPESRAQDSGKGQGGRTWQACTCGPPPGTAGAGGQCLADSAGRRAVHARPRGAAVGDSETLPACLVVDRN